MFDQGPVMLFSLCYFCSIIQGKLGRSFYELLVGSLILLPLKYEYLHVILIKPFPQGHK